MLVVLFLWVIAIIPLSTFSYVFLAATDSFLVPFKRDLLVQALDHWIKIGLECHYLFCSCQGAFQIPFSFIVSNMFLAANISSFDVNFFLFAQQPCPEHFITDCPVFFDRLISKSDVVWLRAASDWMRNLTCWLNLPKLLSTVRM